MQFCSLLPLFCINLYLLACLQWLSNTSHVLVKFYQTKKIYSSFLAAYTFSCIGCMRRCPAQAFFLSLCFSGIFTAQLMTCREIKAAERKNSSSMATSHLPQVIKNPQWVSRFVSKISTWKKFLLREDIFNHHTWTEVILESQGKLPFTSFHYRTVHSVSFTLEHHCNLPLPSNFGGIAARIW